MKSKFEMPSGLPKHACGRCLWWRQTDAKGWGYCRLKRQKCWYQRMICCAYEMCLSDEMQS